MNVAELIEALQKVEDKSLEVRCVADVHTVGNAWLYSIEESSTGSSGHECFGEVRLIASE
jgi:hypothetical protein